MSKDLEARIEELEARVAAIGGHIGIGPHDQELPVNVGAAHIKEAEEAEAAAAAEAAKAVKHGKSA